MAELLCPYCHSKDLERDEVGIAIDMMLPVYYTDYTCNSCSQRFTVKSDDENPLRAIVKEFHWGKFYPDGIGLEDAE